jgi:hypothetical protein
MSTNLEQENTNQFNAEITYTNVSNYTIPISYIKKIELMNAKPNAAGYFQPHAASDYLVVTLYGIKGSNANLSSLQHINNLLGASDISIIYHQYVTSAKPKLYRTKIIIGNYGAPASTATLTKFAPSVLDFENPGNTEYILYFTYDKGYIINNS